MKSKKKAKKRPVATWQELVQKRKDWRKKHPGQWQKDIYDKRYCEAAEKIMSFAWSSKTNLANELYINRKTIASWIDTYPEFKQAIEKGRNKGEVSAMKDLISFASESHHKHDNKIIALLATAIYKLGKDDTQEQDKMSFGDGEKYLREHDIPLPDLLPPHPDMPVD